MLAELVRLNTSDGKVHFGAFYPSQGENPSPLGIVLVHGMTGSFVGEVESALPPLLSRQGFSVMTANNRGNGLLGAATETIAGVVPDIQAVIDDMQARGFERIVLIGHSKGGVKVASYLAQTGDPRVAGLGLLSPAASFRSMPAWMAAQFGGKEPQRWLKKVIKKAAGGKGERIYTDSAWPYLISAGTLADHSAAVGDDVLEILGKVQVPVMAACGSMELDWCSVVATLRASRPAGFTVAVVDGADHVYTGKESALASVVLDWIQKL